MKKIRWGIAGPGIIAHKFAEALAKVENAELVAVASKSADRAQNFAREFDIPNIFSSYEKMADFDGVDAVYVSTAHPFHKDCAEIFLNAKKAVLCEKPLCVNEKQAKELCDTAKKNGAFLMEGVWSLFLPYFAELKKIISRGDIGEIMSLSADFCYSIERDEDPKLFENALAGGSLLDVGVYTIHFASAIFEEYPQNVKAISDIENGIDRHTQMLLSFSNNRSAALSSAIRLEKPFDAYIYGTKGRIYIPDFYKADGFTVTTNDGNSKAYSFAYGDNGFEFEIEDASKRIISGEKESAVLPLNDTLNVAKIMDEIKKSIGLVYPFD